MQIQKSVAVIRILMLTLLVVSGFSCAEKYLDKATEQDKAEEYYSGVNKRFEMSFINQDGLFFDDFETLPAHVHPGDFDDKANITRYSYHSVVEKDEWQVKNESLEEIHEDGTSFLKARLSPGQQHEKINGYRAELTLHGGNKDIQEEWFEWRFMIPGNFKLDSVNLGKEVCIAQLHYVKPEGEEKVIKGPTVLFSFLELNSKNMLLLRYGINGEEDSYFKGHTWKIIALDDSIKKDIWHTLRVNIKWSLTNDGYIAVWLNGQPFTPYNGIHNKVFGANLYNEIENTFKFGYYRYWDNSESTFIYFDYLVKTRSFEMLTGKKPTSENLYGNSEDYRYLQDAVNPLNEQHAPDQ